MSDMRRVCDVAAYTLCALFALAGSLINLNRFWQYESGYYDFGMFDVPIWKVAHFHLPIIDHFLVSGKINLADHFNPSIYLFSPLYWFTSHSEVLFIAQDILVGLSGLVLYRIGIKVLKNCFLSLAVVIAYFLFAGLQNAVYFDFHELTVMTFFLMMVYYAIVANKKLLYFIFFIITLGFKENLFLLGIGLSVFIFFYRKEWRKIAIVTFFYSILWFFIAMNLILYFSGGIYGYQPLLQGSVVDIALRLVTPFIKLKTLFLTLLSFLFLPLFSFSTIPILLLHFAARFLSEGSVRWDLGFHYNAEIAPTLAVASLLGLRYLSRKFSRRIVLCIGIGVIMTSLILYRFILHPAFGLAYHPVFYSHTKDFVYIDKLIAKIPKDHSIATQNNLASAFLHQDVRILREDYKRHSIDYILFDLRPGQNPNNFLGIKDPQKLLQTILHDPDYRVVYNESDQYIFRKK